MSRLHGNRLPMAEILLNQMAPEVAQAPPACRAPVARRDRPQPAASRPGGRYDFAIDTGVATVKVVVIIAELPGMCGKQQTLCIGSTTLLSGRGATDLIQRGPVPDQGAGPFDTRRVRCLAW